MRHYLFFYFQTIRIAQHISLSLYIYILLGYAIIQVPELMISFHAFVTECLLSLRANTKEKCLTTTDFEESCIKIRKRQFTLQGDGKEESFDKTYKNLEGRESEEKFKKINQSIQEMESRFKIQNEEINNKLDQIIQYIKI